MTLTIINTWDYGLWPLERAHLRFEIDQTGRRVLIDFNGAERIVETRPVKKPRGGNTRRLGKYDWEWLNGRWVRKFL